MQIPESDWRLLSKLKPVALERFCERVLNEIRETATDPGLTHHERYLKIYSIVEEQDKTIEHIFNDLRRSNALSRLSRMREQKLITEDEMTGFSGETRNGTAPNV